MKEFLDRRIWHPEMGLSYWCSICGEYKAEADFYKSSRTKWGVDRNCKEHYRNRDADKENKHLRFNNIQKSDFEGAVGILESLGYDMTKNVHTQFVERHKEGLNKKKNKNGKRKQKEK